MFDPCNQCTKKKVENDYRSVEFYTSIFFIRNLLTNALKAPFEKLIKFTVSYLPILLIFCVISDFDKRNNYYVLSNVAAVTFSG